MTASVAVSPEIVPDITLYLPVPAGYGLVSRRKVSVDGERAELTRHERIDGRNAGLGGEHFSTVIDGGGRLKGFVRFDLALTEGTLPSRDQAREVALAFLEKLAPDLLASFEIRWIEPHDEKLRVTGEGGSESRTLTGMKVKMLNTADGRWFWVIVGTDGEVAVFERDIVWITIPGHRQTEKWLHDDWLADKAGAAAR